MHRLYIERLAFVRARLRFQHLGQLWHSFFLPSGARTLLILPPSFIFYCFIVFFPTDPHARSLTCFPDGARIDLWRNWRSLASDGAPETLQTASATARRATAHWIRVQGIFKKSWCNIFDGEKRNRETRQVLLLKFGGFCFCWLPQVFPPPLIPLFLNSQADVKGEGGFLCARGN